MPKKRLRKNIVKELDKLFSLYIRHSHKNPKTDLVECFTCGRSYEVKKIQAGHFQSRRFYSTRWDEDNVKPQCYGCNVGRQGEQYIFAKNLNNLKTGLAEDMEAKSRLIVKYMDFELLELIEIYKKKLKELKVY